jgi:hypothetical protein
MTLEMAQSFVVVFLFKRSRGIALGFRQAETRSVGLICRAPTDYRKWGERTTSERRTRANRTQYLALVALLLTQEPLSTGHGYDSKAVHPIA